MRTKRQNYLYEYNTNLSLCKKLSKDKLLDLLQMSEIRIKLIRKLLKVLGGRIKKGGRI